MNRQGRGEVQKVWSIMWESEGGIKRYLKSEATSYYFLPNIDTTCPTSSQGTLSPEFISLESIHLTMWNCSLERTTWAFQVP